MMKRIVLAAGLLICTQAPLSRAADLNDLPSGTKWVLNLDLKAAQASPMINFAIDKIAPAKRREVQTKFAAIKALFGIDLLKDISQVVIAGNGNAEKGGVAYVYGVFDVDRLSTILAANQNFTTAQHSGFTVLGWKDDSQKYLSFARPGLAMLSGSQTALTEALDVLAEKKAGLAADSSFKPALSGKGSVLTVMAIDVPSIVGEQPKAQALRQAQALCLRVNASQSETLSAALSVTATSEETAVQIRQALMGIQALAQLRANEAPEQATLASLAKISGEGKQIGVTLDLPKSVIETAIREREAREAAKAAPAAAK
jgi:hypothetical protein